MPDDLIIPRNNSRGGGLSPSGASQFTAWLMCAVTALAALVLVQVFQLKFANADDTLQVTVPLLGLLGFCRIYLFLRLPEARRLSSFTSAVLMIITFVFAGNCLQYAFAMKPVFDATGAVYKVDLAMGFDGPGLIRWVQSVPWLARASALSYSAMFHQVWLAILIFPLCGRDCDLYRLFSRMMCGILITTVISGLINVVPYNPAELVAQGVIQTSSNLRCYDQIFGMRYGGLATLDLAEPCGMVSLPSYHMQMAAFLALAYHRIRWLAVAAFALNAAMACSALVDGLHYLADIIAGGFVAAGVVCLMDTLEKYAVGIQVSGWRLPRGSAEMPA